MNTFNIIIFAKSMSNREKCISLLDSFTDAQLGSVIRILQAAKDCN